MSVGGFFSFPSTSRPCHVACRHNSCMGGIRPKGPRTNSCKLLVPLYDSSRVIGGRHFPVLWPSASPSNGRWAEGHARNKSLEAPVIPGCVRQAPLNTSIIVFQLALGVGGKWLRALNATCLYFSLLSSVPSPPRSLPIPLSPSFPALPLPYFSKIDSLPLAPPPYSGKPPQLGHISHANHTS